MFNAINQVLQRAKALPDAAEAHGVICGFLCLSPAGDDEPWLQHILADSIADELLADDCRRVLLRLRDYTKHRLESSSCEIIPLLPNDEQPLAARTTALRDWCQGFLFGLGLGGLKDFAGLPAEGGEFIRDLDNFCRVDTDTGESEENEAAYFELTEYIRVGMLTLSEGQAWIKANLRDAVTN
ncbi:MAG: UPF0149 family protein [Gammaproteobacteria bacterium]|nr:UPF0149 family protein [Gammaproteobacteria bacterium]